MEATKNADKDEMTPDERLIWLRERGITVETSEDRRRKQIKDIMGEKDEVDGKEYESLSFVHVPQDESLPMKEMTMMVPKERLGSGDLLLDELKPFFTALSKKVDVSLFGDQATKHFGSGDGEPVKVSEDTLRKVAEEGQVEKFSLVNPMPSNKFTSVNIYLDEIGLLKRLPMNKRAAEFGLKCGFNPAPKFYGDVFLGRVISKPVLKNVNFKKGADTAPDADWLINATMENLEYQSEMNKITGQGGRTQSDADGENGVAKIERDGLYSWTQTDEEVEIALPLGATDDGKALSSKDVKAGGLKVKFTSKKVQVSFKGKDMLSLALFSNVDPDGCTWTLEIGKETTSLVITCEKVDGMSWPRVTV